MTDNNPEISEAMANVWGFDAEMLAAMPPETYRAVARRLHSPRMLRIAAYADVSLAPKAATTPPDADLIRDLQTTVPPGSDAAWAVATMIANDRMGEAPPSSRETIDIPARSVITGADKSCIEHALELALRVWTADAETLDARCAAGTLSVLEPDTARFVVEGHRQYAEQARRIIERLDGSLFIAFVEDDD